MVRYEKVNKVGYVPPGVDFRQSAHKSMIRQIHSVVATGYENNTKLSDLKSSLQYSGRKRASSPDLPYLRDKETATADIIYSMRKTTCEQMAYIDSLEYLAPDTHLTGPKRHVLSSMLDREIENARRAGCNTLKVIGSGEYHERILKNDIAKLRRRLGAVPTPQGIVAEIEAHEPVQMDLTNNMRTLESLTSEVSDNEVFRALEDGRISAEIFGSFWGSLAHLGTTIIETVFPVTSVITPIVHQAIDYFDR